MIYARMRDCVSATHLQSLLACIYSVRQMSCSLAACYCLPLVFHRSRAVDAFQVFRGNFSRGYSAGILRRRLLERLPSAKHSRAAASIVVHHAARRRLWDPAVQGVVLLSRRYPAAQQSR